MNKIILTGRITKDIELKESSNGNNYIQYTIAVRRDSETTDFINCVTFGEFAKTMQKAVKKGDMLGIEGRLQINSYEKDGVKHQTYSVVTERIDFLSNKHEYMEKEEVKEESIKSDTFEITDDDLPF